MPQNKATYLRDMGTISAYCVGVKKEKPNVGITGAIAEIRRRCEPAAIDWRAFAAERLKQKPDRSGLNLALLEFLQGDSLK